MSVRLTSASSQNLGSTTTPNYDAAYTWAAWVYPITITGDPTPFSISVDGSNYDQGYINTGVFRWRASSTAAGIADCIGTLAVIANSWVFVAFRRDSSTQHTIFAGLTPETITQQDQTTLNIAARSAANRVDMGSFRNSSNYYNGRMIGMRLWTRSLSLVQLQAEAYFVTPQDITNLYAYWPVIQAGDYTDYSGSGRNLTATGSPTTEDNPNKMYRGSRNNFEIDQGPAPTIIRPNAIFSYGGWT